MTEPHTSTAIGVCAGAGVTLPFCILGADPIALIISTIIATFMSFWLKKVNSIGRVACGVAVSGLASSLCLPWLVSWIQAAHPELSNRGLPAMLAVLFGIGGPTMIPLLLKRAEKKLEEM